MNKIMLRTSDAWLTSRLSHRTSKQAYHIEDWRIRDHTCVFGLFILYKKFCPAIFLHFWMVWTNTLWLRLLSNDNTNLICMVLFKQCLLSHYGRPYWYTERLNQTNKKFLNLHLSIVQSALQYGHVVSPLFSHSLIQFAWYSWPHDRGFASSQHILSQQMQHWRFSSLTSNKCSFPCSSFCLYSLFKCSSFLLYLW